MRAIITGGSGLVGSEMVRSLASDGYDVVVLSRSPESLRDLPAGARAERWDGRTTTGWGPLADGADAIINLAGQNLLGLWTEDYKRRIRQSRVDAGQAVLQAVRQAQTKPRLVIQSSGIGHYGIERSGVLTESAAPGTDFLASVTLDWEASTAPVEEMGVRRIIVRTAVVLTPKGGILPLFAIPHRLFVGGPLGHGQQWFPWIHIADWVGALRFLMERPDAQGPFNLASPYPLTNAEFGKALGRVLGRPSWLPVPAFALKLVLRDMADMVLYGQRAIPEKLLKLGYTFRYPQAEEALRDVLIKP